MGLGPSGDPTGSCGSRCPPPWIGGRAATRPGPLLHAVLAIIRSCRPGAGALDPRPDQVLWLHDVPAPGSGDRAGGQRPEPRDTAD